MQILIADDEVVSRARLKRALAGLGHDVIEATNGRDAWKFFEERDVSLLIADWMMPNIDGLELCRMIRAEHRAKYTYIIMLTALGGKGSYLEGMKAGADDFITKPFDPDSLLARVHVAQRILALQAEVSRLEGLLPICTYCKRIRDEHQVWTQIESFISTRTAADFYHGICPECFATQVMPQVEAMKREPLKAT